MPREFRLCFENQAAVVLTGCLVAFPSCSEDPFGEQDDLLRLEQDVIVPLAASRKMFVYESADFWRQIKTAGSAVPASALYLAQFQKTNSKFLTPPGKAGSGGPMILPPVFIDPTAEVDETAKIGPNVSLGRFLTQVSDVGNLQADIGTLEL